MKPEEAAAILDVCQELFLSAEMSLRGFEKLVAAVNPLVEFEDPHGTFKCPRCGGAWFGSTRPPGSDDFSLVHCNDQFQIGCRWKGSRPECGLK